MKEKKDIFNGMIKKEYFSYILVSMIFLTLLFLGVGGLVLGVGIWANAGPTSSIMVMRILGIALILLGFAYFFITVLVIRKYPKYEKLRRIVLNSDIYFVDGTSKEFRGRRRDRAVFEMVTQAAEQNKDLASIKYPKKYKIYVALTVIGIVLMFIYIAIAYILLENIESLPAVLQNEAVIFGVFMIVWVVNIILSFVFAFRVKKIREAVRREYRRKKRGYGQE